MIPNRLGGSRAWAGALPGLKARSQAFRGRGGAITRRTATDIEEHSIGGARAEKIRGVKEAFGGHYR